MSSVVGFDFGNMSCYISVARQGGIDVLTNDYSLHATPSCVAFGPKNRVVGVAARQQVFTNFKNTVLNFKHFLGRKYNDPVVQQLKDFVPCDVVELPNGNIGFNVNYLGEERLFSTEQITGALLFKLKQITESQIGQRVNDCVISVPFFFTDLQRRSLLAAAKIAGLNVLKIVHESTSIGIAYGIYKSGLLPPEADPPKLVAFVDVGHSTVQATLASFHERKLTVLGSTFDLTVGGMHFDTVIRDYFRQDIIQRYKIDPKTSPKHWLRLLDECERLKKQMSANATPIPFHIECFMNDKDISGQMARAQFEEIAEPLFGKIRNLLMNLLKETGVQAKDVSEVELIGGSSRIPYIKQIVAHIFNREPKTTMNQDEAVARGAGMMCAILSPSFKVKEFHIKDYVPFDIKLVYQGSGGGKAETIVFKKAEDFPFAKMLTLMKSENFSVVGMYEKPNDIPYTDTYLGSWEVHDVTPLNGEPRKIKAKLRMDGHGVFSLASAITTEELPPEEDEQMEEPPKDQPMDEAAQQDESSQKNGSQKEGEQKPKEKKTRKLTIEYPIVENVPFALNVEECILAEQEMQARDFEVKSTADAKNAVEEFCYSMRDKISGELAEFVLHEEVASFQGLLQETEDWLYDEGEDAEKPVYVHRLNELKAKIEIPILERYQKKFQEEERIRKEAEEKAKQAAEAAKAKEQPSQEKMHVDETGDSTQTKEKSPKGKK